MELSAKSRQAWWRVRQRKEWGEMANEEKRRLKGLAMAWKQTCGNRLYSQFQTWRCGHTGTHSESSLTLFCFVLSPTAFYLLWHWYIQLFSTCINPEMRSCMHPLGYRLWLCRSSESKNTFRKHFSSLFYFYFQSSISYI